MESGSKNIVDDDSINQKIFYTGCRAIWQTTYNSTSDFIKIIIKTYLHNTSEGSIMIRLLMLSLHGVD